MNKNQFISLIILSIGIFIIAGFEWGLIINMFLWVGFFFFIPLFNMFLSVEHKRNVPDKNSEIKSEAEAERKKPSFKRIMFAANILPAFVTLEALVYSSYSSTMEFYDSNLMRAMPFWVVIINIFAILYWFITSLRRN